MRAYLQALRFGRWPRSLAIYTGSAAYFYLNREAIPLLHQPEILFRLALAFFLTWGISTANYIINEIVDAPFDLHHPTKRFRPLVSGRVGKNPLVFLCLALVTLCFLLSSLLFSLPLLLSLVALLIAGFIYNIRPVRTKDIPFLDSISESANNPIRFFIGWFAVSPPGFFPPLSLLLNWWAFGNFLLIAKRLSEFRLLKEKAGNYRRSLNRYSQSSLASGMAASAGLFFITYFVFALGYKLESFLYLSPLVFIYFFLIFLKTLKEKEVMEEPERLLKHFWFAAYTLALLLLFVLSAFVDKIHR